MMKKTGYYILAGVMAILLSACGKTDEAETANGNENAAAVETVEAEAAVEAEAEESLQASKVEESADDFRIGIVTGSYAQSEDDRRGAEAFLKKYGEDTLRWGETIKAQARKFTWETAVEAYIRYYIDILSMT